MSRKILIFNGSPRKNGNTAALVEALSHMEWFIEQTLTVPEKVETIAAVMSKDMSRLAMHPQFAELKQQWHDQHWDEDIQNAFDAGKRMAEKVLL